MRIVSEPFDPARATIDDAAQVLTYLDAGVVVRAATGCFVDAIRPERTFRHAGLATDGVLIWPVATTYYLGRYGLAPSAALLAHVRAADYRIPVVSTWLVEQAHRVVRSAS
jgi:hypothetical protein